MNKGLTAGSMSGSMSDPILCQNYYYYYDDYKVLRFALSRSRGWYRSYQVPPPPWSCSWDDELIVYFFSKKERQVEYIRRMVLCYPVTRTSGFDFILSLISELRAV